MLRCRWDPLVAERIVCCRQDCLASRGRNLQLSQLSTHLREKTRGLLRDCASRSLLGPHHPREQVIQTDFHGQRALFRRLDVVHGDFQLVARTAGESIAEKLSQFLGLGTVGQVEERVGLEQCALLHRLKPAVVLRRVGVDPHHQCCHDNLQVVQREEPSALPDYYCKPHDDATRTTGGNKL